MARIAVGIEYDGTAFSGWQGQTGQRTVQGVAEAALARIADAPVALVCAGRTDAGVHAAGQVAHFDTEAVRPARSWVLGANSELPADVSLCWAHTVPAHFHARYSAQARTYRYLILNRTARSALHRQRCAFVHRPLEVSRMAQACPALLGEHDFSALRSSECQAKSAVRCIERLTVERREDWVVIEVTANAFLHHMVRNLAGLLIAIGRGDAPPDWAAQVLAGRDRTRSAATAPAQGLCLVAVRYPAAFGLPVTPGEIQGPDRL
ncbi:MAG: tRNA pseudouridine(38-40) synthase TruA [Proteobacteria bacterium]|nr:tRNA pseudouridine(38-40) synthase TruA [Pseudomonadota bacterium]